MQQDDAKRPAQENPAADAQQRPSTPVPTTPEQAKPKRVITNDDLLQGFSNEGLGLSPAEFNEVNNCDRSCFECLRQSARIDSGDARWRRKVLQAVDLVRKDPEWQKILHEIYDLHFKLCDLADQEREELNRDGDPRNVTRQQISIEEKYEARLKDLQEQLRAVQARQSALVSKANDNLIAYRFRIYQENRKTPLVRSGHTPITRKTTRMIGEDSNHTCNMLWRETPSDVGGQRSSGGVCDLAAGIAVCTISRTRFCSGAPCTRTSQNRRYRHIGKAEAGRETEKGVHERRFGKASGPSGASEFG